MSWPFPDPPDSETRVDCYLLLGGAWVQQAVHSPEDNGWQFWTCPVEPEEVCIISLYRALELDPSLQQIADLPPGWVAWRTAPDRPWQRQAGTTLN